MINVVIRKLMYIRLETSKAKPNSVQTIQQSKVILKLLVYYTKTCLDCTLVFR